MVRGTGPSTTIGDADLPPLYLDSDRRALARQSESIRAVRTQLVVLLLATAAAALAEHLRSHIASACAAVLYALTTVIGVHTSRRRARAHWQAHRAVAETLKSLAWQYMVHGGPFHSRVANPEALFADRLEERLRELRKMGWQDSRGGTDTMGAGQITPRMRAVRAKSFEARRDIYLRDRVLEQLIWYGNRASRAHRASVRWSSVTAALTSLALLAATLRAFGVIGSWDFAGLLSAGAAAGVAWQEVRRHRPLTYAHSLIEQDLDTLRVAMGTTVTEEGWAEAVAEAERLVSPQHTDWLVRFGS
ncbi:DUF4231 domain-containing protein [Streptomyces chiangmaiensis]|uniref:DUF4231 domain-containing protein n=1 Tax=Streptomyces chiangmaiensis TaxID=766497 RepID=A0ABU7FGY3_9ACTN|nr:DUF4231 domain-containing protein [Streptomyces chiangmaiensis]MED7823204.1 DUF4231 domain-containing protein [Streptomyces chiangmaiensis]